MFYQMTGLGLEKGYYLHISKNFCLCKRWHIPLKMCEGESYH